MNNSYDIGMIGLGTMGRNLALNIADHGFSVAGYNRHLDKVALLEQEAEGRKVLGVKSEEELTKALRKPRAIMMMVPAGKAVDQVIRGLLPYLEAGDIIIDGGNSHYKDTNIRGEALSGKGIHFLGVGISGGEKGARFGPSVMPGGQKEAYERVRPIFEAAAAKVDGKPVCHLPWSRFGRPLCQNGPQWNRIWVDAVDLRDIPLHEERLEPE